MKILITASVSDDPGKLYVDLMSRLGAESDVISASGERSCASDYADRFSGLLLSGGVDADPSLYGAPFAHPKTVVQPERDELELAMMKEFVRRGKPVFGICRGIQMINVYFGGDLIQHIPDEVKNPICHIKEGFAEHDIVACDSPIRRLFPESGVLRVNSSHHQAVNNPGGGIVVAARSSDGIAEVICHRTKPILGVQFHPERDLPRPLEGMEAFAKEFLRLCSEAD